MRNIFLSLGVLCASSSAFAQVQLPWTSSSNSVQAVVWEALSLSQRTDDGSPFPQRYIERIAHDDVVVLSVKDATSELGCESGSFGMTAVQSYQCSFSKRRFAWTSSSDSVQAVLWNALNEFKRVDDLVADRLNYVLQGPRGELVVEDAAAKLTCESKSLGMVAVQSYRCQLKIK